jgi:LmbE family N-acetylglucosaminyl deacetylase
MPFMGRGVKAVFEELKSISSHLIFTDNRKDAHQDHRLISKLTWNTFREHFILEYEIPKYDGPNLFVPVAYEVCEQQVRYLMDPFESQRSKRWFQPETFFGLMRLKGTECNALSGYAEALYCRKLAVAETCVFGR